MQHITSTYKIWRQCLTRFPKRSRFTLGNKIDNTLIAVLEWTSIATYQPPDKKIPALQKAIAQTDLLKCFLRVAWEVKDLDNKKYISLSESVDEMGRMLGGWLRKMQSKTSTAREAAEE